MLSQVPAFMVIFIIALAALFVALCIVFVRRTMPRRQGGTTSSQRGKSHVKA